MFTDEDIKELNAMYHEEEMEMELGIHPLQIKERIEEILSSQPQTNEKKITFLDWDIEGPRVSVILDGNFYGVFNYEDNKFESAKVKEWG